MRRRGRPRGGRPSSAAATRGADHGPDPGRSRRRGPDAVPAWSRSTPRSPAVRPCSPRTAQCRRLSCSRRLSRPGRSRGLPEAVRRRPHPDGARREAPAAGLRGLSPFGLTGPWRDHPAARSSCRRPLRSCCPTAPRTIRRCRRSSRRRLRRGGADRDRDCRSTVRAGHLGLGQFLDQAEFDALAAFAGTLLPSYFLSGGPPRRLGNRHAMAAPWNTYRTADSWVVIGTMNEIEFRALCSAMAERT